jgi:hypothetical protein
MEKLLKSLQIHQKKLSCKFGNFLKALAKLFHEIFGELLKPFCELSN